jgi:hypothetical protein
LEVPPELFVAVGVEAFDGGVLDGAVHPLDLTIGPGVVDAGEAVLDAMLLASHGEDVGHGSGRGPVGVAGREAELVSVVGEHGVDPVGHGSDARLEEGGCGDPRCALDHLSEGELAGAIDGNEEVELSFGGLHLGAVDVKEADGV